MDAAASDVPESQVEPDEEAATPADDQADANALVENINNEDHNDADDASDNAEGSDKDNVEGVDNINDDQELKEDLKGDSLGGTTQLPDTAVEDNDQLPPRSG